MTQLFTNSDQILSCGKCRRDELFGETASGGDGQSAEARHVIAVIVSDFFDDTEIAQSSELAGNAGL